MSNKFPFDQFLHLDLNETTAKNNSLHGTPVQSILNSGENNPRTHKSPSQQRAGVDELSALSTEILSVLRNSVSSTQFATYFSHAFTLSELAADYVEFTVTTGFIKKMIDGQYIPTIKKVLVETLGREYDVRISVYSQSKMPPIQESLTNFSYPTPETSRKQSGVKENTFILDEINPTKDDLLKAIDSQVIEHLEAKPANGFVDPKRNFETFIVGPSNNLAHASALAVSKDPGMVYPNLYIYGNSGLGKTHLIHSIANRILHSKPHLRVCIISLLNFMTEYTDSIRKNEALDFRKKYIEQTDVLIIDDIHELSNKQGTQEQFFHIVNELSNRRKQLIFTSDKTPKEITGIEDRIKTRLSSALMVEIHQPDLETRIAILKSKSQEKDIYLGDDVVDHIARSVKTNIRELEGCLIKLGAYSSLMNVDIDLEIAKEQLKLTDSTDTIQSLDIEKITRSVSQFFKVPIGDLRGKAKTKEIAQARQVAMYLIYTHLKLTLMDIAQFFGKKDHTTVLYSIRQVKEKLTDDTILAQQVSTIEGSF